MQHSTGSEVKPALDNQCIWDIIREWNFWCRRKTVGAQESELDINRFMVIFTDAFNSSYSGIESLALYQKVNLRRPFSKFRFMQPSWKVKRDQFQSLSSFNKRPSEQSYPKEKILTSYNRVGNGYTDSGAQGALTEAEIKAVSTIQSFWGHYWQLLLEKRKFDKTPEGKAIKWIDHQFQVSLNTMDKVLPSKMLRWTIFRDQGVHVVLKIHETELIIEKMLSKVIMRMKTGGDLEWTERGALDDVYQNLCQAKYNMAALKKSVLDKNVVACPVEKLGHTLAEFRGRAMGLSKAVGDIRMEITRIEGQIAGRSASASISLKTPGEKRLR